MQKLEIGHYYHIYNRGINGEIIFKDSSNMDYFLNLIIKHLVPDVNILAFCLMNNHFHLIVKINKDEKKASQVFSNLFNAYAKAYNKQNSRTRSLFERPFNRIHIKDESYLKNLVLSIHKKPQNHSAISNFSDYKFSSYSYYLSKEKSTIISDKDYVLNLFDDLENFIYTHKNKDNDQDPNR